MEKGNLRIVCQKGIPGIRLTIAGKGKKDDIYTFHIMEGTRMSRAQEELFERFCEIGTLRLHISTMERIFQCFSTRYPEIHLKKYSDAGLILAHIYYALNRVEVKEILYKANLEILAANLYRTEDYNIIGSSPQEIYDNIPVKVLRALNSSRGLKLIDTELKRMQLCEVYHKYAKVIPNIGQLTDIQWRYLLKEYYEGNEIDISTLRYLKKVHSEIELYNLLIYQERIAAVTDYYKFPKFPSWEKRVVNDPYYMAGSVFYVAVLYEKWFNKRLEQQYRDGGYLLEGGDKYKVYFPRSVKEICNESEKQHNCLWRYVSGLAYGDKVVLFVKDAVTGKTVADVELSADATIYQALGKYNEDVCEELMQWIEEYVRAKVELHRNRIECLFTR